MIYKIVNAIFRIENRREGKKMLSFVLSIIGIIFIFALKNIFGLFFAIVAFIIALVQLKKKQVFNSIGLVVSVVLIIYSIYAFVIASNEVGNIIGSSQEGMYSSMEMALAQGAVISVEEEERECAESGSACALPPSLTVDLDYASNYREYESTLKECDGYIELNYSYPGGWDAKTYLSCPDYETEGYEN